MVLKTVPAIEHAPKAAEKIYRILKDEIRRGEIESGALLSESQLAKRFEVSRTPVREALSMLASDHLIASYPQRGHLVQTITFSEFMDACRIRELLEVESVRLAVQHISDETISYLKVLIATVKQRDLVAFNYEFHTTIAKASGNRVLAEFIEEILIRMERILAAHPDLAKYTERTIHPEFEIVEALEQRDERAACEAMRSHIQDTMRKLIQTN